MILIIILAEQYTGVASEPQSSRAATILPASSKELIPALIPNQKGKRSTSDKYTTQFKAQKEEAQCVQDYQDLISSIGSLKSRLSIVWASFE